MGFLAGFSDRFMLALGIWPFASFLLTLPLLAFLYRRDGQLRLLAAAGAYAAVLYGLALVFFTLWPLPEGTEGLGITYGIEPQLDPLAFIGDIRRDGVKAVFQIAANVAFFVPLGFIARRGLRLGLIASTAVGLAASALIETAQLTGLFGLYPYAYRTFDVDDLAWNVAGAALGWLAAALLARLLPEGRAYSQPVTHEPGFVRRAVALCVDMTIFVGAIGASALLVMVASYLPVVGALWSAGGAEALAAAAVALFVVLEAIVPWACGGSTPGGSFVRMSCETKERAGARRLAFYGARLAVIVACLMVWPWPACFLAVPLVLGFYLVARKMPYDCI